MPSSRATALSLSFTGISTGRYKPTSPLIGAGSHVELKAHSKQARDEDLDLVGLDSDDLR